MIKQKCLVLDKYIKVNSSNFFTSGHFIIFQYLSQTGFNLHVSLFHCWRALEQDISPHNPFTLFLFLGMYKQDLPYEV